MERRRPTDLASEGGIVIFGLRRRADGVELMRKLRALLTAAAIFAVPVAGAVAAEQPRLLSEHGAWAAYAYDDNGGQVCYVASRPERQQGDYQRRGEPFVLVAHRPAAGARGEVSVVAGYTYQAQSNATAEIGKETFTFYTQDDTAWARDNAAAKLVRSMRAGSQMVVKGTSSRGTLTTDTYSLIGFTAAMQAIDRACPGS